MSVTLVPTKVVRMKDSGAEAIINESDFNPALHVDPSVKNLSRSASVAPMDDESSKAPEEPKAEQEPPAKTGKGSDKK